MTHPTEAELEARISSTLARVFPGVTELRHQLRFKVRVGRSVLDAGANDYVDGRADIVVYQGKTALAVLELKREGLALTSDDEDQGCSYALLVRAPIVVVTNGVDTRIFQTHDMATLVGTTIPAEEVARRIESAAIAASAGTSAAISKLLGTDLAASAIAKMTETELEDLTGDWNGSERFVRNFLVPRSATVLVRKALGSEKHKVVLVTGAPLSGKSSVLRELALNAEDDSFDIVYVEGSSCGEGLFRRLANLLAAEFSWPASTDESRVWLRQLVNRPHRTVVLCVDSVPLGSSVLMSELDELITSHGDRLRIVMAVDENDIDRLVFKSNGREHTRIGRHSLVVNVGNYDDEEFYAAGCELSALGGGLVNGAKYAPELRAPWVLRASSGLRLIDLQPGEKVVLPPLLGREMFDLVDERFVGLGELRDDFRRLALAYIDNSVARHHHGDALASMYLFSIPQDLVRQHLERDAIKDLVRAGLLKRGKAFSGDATYTIGLPELFGQEVAARLATLLRKHAKRDADEAASWLVRTCSKMPLGDAIGAQALCTVIHEIGGKAYFRVINGLLRRPPRRERLTPGSKMVMLLPDVGLIDMKVGEDGMLTMSHRGAHGRWSEVEVQDDKDLTAVSDMDGWLILSQMREFRLALAEEDEILCNAAVPLLLQLGKCPVVLRRPGKELEGFHTHEIGDNEMSCFSNGIAEPVTWAIAELLVQNVTGVDRDAWVREASGSNSLPLINRLAQALTHISKLRGATAWAEEMLDAYCRPALSEQLLLH